MSDPDSNKDSSERINAKVMAHEQTNTVGLGLISVSGSSRKMSIFLSPEDSLLLAERLITAAMKLKRPPGDKAMKDFLGKLLGAMQSKK